MRQHVTLEDYEAMARAAVLYAAPPPGPGSALKALLKKIGIQPSPTCQCNSMAAQMDRWGPDECLDHIEEIVDVMAETARARRLPFIRSAGRALVRLAIYRSRVARAAPA